MGHFEVRLKRRSQIVFTSDFCIGFAANAVFVFLFAVSQRAYRTLEILIPKTIGGATADLVTCALHDRLCLLFYRTCSVLAGHSTLWRLLADRWPPRRPL